ncbi:MAG: IS66 family transposase, partial [Candidatus Saccharimonadales bacterium]
MNKLSDAQIKRRLQEGRNYKRLYFDLKGRFDELAEAHKQCPKQLAELQGKLDTQAIQIAELQTMVFGRKRKPPTGHYVPDLPKEDPNPRDKSSYRRPTPPAHAVTHEEPVPLPKTCACGGHFTRITQYERYEEDIPLPDLTDDYQAHLVTKYVIERGVCGSCGKTTAGKDLGGQEVTLGSNIRLLICHLVTVMGLSYAQVIQLATALYGFHLTDGEIASALNKQSQRWTAAYEKLKADTRASPVKHFDETPWKIRDADNSGYAWVMSAADSPNTVFHLATSRGTRHARDLHGDSTGIHISDDYGPYRNLDGQQQL